MKSDELTHPVHGAHSVPDGDADTPEVDKVFDMISDREQPDGGRWGDTPSKWSYEAILDLTDFARKLERERDEAQALFKTSCATSDHWFKRAQGLEAEHAAMQSDILNKSMQLQAAIKNGVKTQVALVDAVVLREKADAELAAQLAELTAISDALGTDEGHSSVDHILALR
ncbi:hypothetical protein UFOVP1053_64, partial [uncultured Caudovirales phage]